MLKLELWGCRIAAPLPLSNSSIRGCPEPDSGPRAVRASAFAAPIPPPKPTIRGCPEPDSGPRARKETIHDLLLPVPTRHTASAVFWCAGNTSDVVDEKCDVYGTDAA